MDTPIDAGILEENSLIARYELLRQEMRERIDLLSARYDKAFPLNKLFALLEEDETLERIDCELCKLEEQLPDWYEPDLPN